MKSITISIFSIFLFTIPAMAEVKYVSETGFIVENKITVKKPATKLWAALVNDVDKWWPKDHTWWGEQGQLTIQPRAGGCFCETAQDRSAEHMHISFVEPNKLLRMTGGLGPLQGMGLYGALDWQFATNHEGTHVTLTYKVNGINPEGYDSLAKIVAKVQGIQLNALKGYLTNTD